MPSQFAHFSGRIIQIIEALDIHDAVSNHALNLDRMFRESFHLESEIYAAFFHPQTKNFGKNIDLLKTDERDILFYHFSGYAPQTAPKVICQKSVKIFHYHNITPHEFFLPDSPIYRHCYQGRKQLREILIHFDLFTGDSQFNIEELLTLGTAKEKTQVLSIVVDPSRLNQENPKGGHNNVLFVGRIVENKRQDRIVEAYARWLKKGYPLGKLILVGDYDSSSQFYRHLVKLIQHFQIQDNVMVTGKIRQDELHSHYLNADFFISMSEHEGFGVPLLEACRYGVPVLALSKTAVPETLKESPGLFQNDAQVDDLVLKLGSDQAFRNSLIAYQYIILDQLQATLNEQAIALLSQTIPKKNEFCSVSIVICTCNRGDFLERVLDYLEYQHDPRFEVIVVNGPSIDQTTQVLKKYGNRLKIGKNPETNLSISRNIGIQLASGDIVAFIDDDALPFDDWVSTLLSEYNSIPKLVGGIGGCTYLAGTFEFQAEDILIDSFGQSLMNPSQEELLRPDRFRTLLGTNSSFRRDVLFEIGGFDEEYDYFLDESDVCLRLLKAGYRLLHSKELYVRHEFAQSVNRMSKYHYNWYSICKNTTYFSLKFNDDSHQETLSTVRKLIQQNRVGHIEQGRKKNRLDETTYSRLLKDIWQGVEDGYEHAQDPRHLQSFKEPPLAFHPYLTQDGPRTFETLHIVLVSKEFPPFTSSGGVGTLYYHLASELLLMGHRVSVIAQDTQHCGHPIYKRGRFTLYRIPLVPSISFNTGSNFLENNLNWSLAVSKQLLDIDRHETISMIDTSIWDVELYAFALFKKHTNIPITVRLVTPFEVACKENSWPVSEFHRKMMMALERELIELADWVIPISYSIEQMFQDCYQVTPDTRWRKIPVGIAYWPSHEVDHDYTDVSQLPELMTAKKAGKKILLFVGRLEIRKGVDVLLASIQCFAEHHPGRDDYLFVLAGKDCMELANGSAMNQIDKTIRERILLLGEVSATDREKLYASAYATIFPSRYESFGLIPLESFVHGKPVIASNAGAIPEVVEHNSCGLLFEDGNPEALADCFDLILNEQDWYEQLAKGTKKRIREFSSRKMALKSEDVYQSILRD